MAPNPAHVKRLGGLVIVASAFAWLAVWPPGATHGLPLNQLVAMERVSVADDETQLGGESFAPIVTPDGRLVLFTNAAAVTHQEDPQVYLRDRTAGTTTSFGPAEYGFGISDDGRYVGLQRDVGAVVLDRETGEEHLVATERASWLSPDGCEVALRSAAVHDWCAGTTEVLVLDPPKYQYGGVGMSRTGRFALYRTEDGRIVRHDRETGENLVVGRGDNPSISDDGSVLLYQRHSLRNPAGIWADYHEMVLADLDAGTERVVFVEEGATQYPTRPLTVAPDGRRAVFAALESTVPGATLSGFRLLDVASGVSDWVLVEDGGPPDSPASPELTDGGLLVFSSRGVEHDPLDELVEYPDCFDDGQCDHDVFALPVA